MHACKENLTWTQPLGVWLGSQKSLRAIYYPYLDLGFSTYKITKVEDGRLGRVDLGERQSSSSHQGADFSPQSISVNV